MASRPSWATDSCWSVSIWFRTMSVISETWRSSTKKDLVVWFSTLVGVVMDDDIVVGIDIGEKASFISGSIE